MDEVKDVLVRTIVQIMVENGINLIDIADVMG